MFDGSIWNAQDLQKLEHAMVVNAVLLFQTGRPNLPCLGCRKHSRKWIRKYPFRVESHTTLLEWANYLNRLRKYLLRKKLKTLLRMDSQEVDVNTIFKIQLEIASNPADSYQKYLAFHQDSTLQNNDTWILENVFLIAMMMSIETHIEILVQFIGYIQLLNPSQFDFLTPLREHLLSREYPNNDPSKSPSTVEQLHRLNLEKWTFVLKVLPHSFHTMFLERLSNIDFRQK